MSVQVYTVELTISQVGLIQRALRLAGYLGSATFIDASLDDPLDIEHLRTWIAETVTDQGFGQPPTTGGTK